jgi:hypothetical protein
LSIRFQAFQLNVATDVVLLQKWKWLSYAEYLMVIFGATIDTSIVYQSSTVLTMRVPQVDTEVDW